MAPRHPARKAIATARPRRIRRNEESLRFVSRSAKSPAKSTTLAGPSASRPERSATSDVHRRRPVVLLAPVVQGWVCACVSARVFLAAALRAPVTPPRVLRSLRAEANTRQPTRNPSEQAPRRECATANDQDESEQFEGSVRRDRWPVAGGLLTGAAAALRCSGLDRNDRKRRRTRRRRATRH